MELKEYIEDKLKQIQFSGDNSLNERERLILAIKKVIHLELLDLVEGYLR